MVAVDMNAFDKKVRRLSTLLTDVAGSTENASVDKTYIANKAKKIVLLELSILNYG